MSRRYRLKRNSAAVTYSIPVHPDAIYRPIPMASIVAQPRAVIGNTPIIAAPMAAGGGAFSPWWILGPLLGLLVAMALGLLAYTTMKKGEDQEKNNDDPAEEPRRETPLTTNGIIEKKEIRPLSRARPESKEITSHPRVNDLLPSSTSNPIKNIVEASLPPSSTSISAGNLPLTFSPSTGPEFSSLPLFHSEPKKKTKKEEKPTSSLLLQDQNRNPFDEKQSSPVSPHGMGNSPLLSSFPTGREPKSNQDNADEHPSRSLSSDKNKSEVPATKRSQADEKLSLMPDVPQCKTSGSSDVDEDYDDVYPVQSSKENRNTKASNR